MMEPREIEDEEHERVLERVAAIDVAKASGMVCVRVPHPSRPGSGGHPGLGGGRDDARGDRAGGAAGRSGDRDGHRRVDLRLLADLVLPAGGGRAERAASQRPGREERARAGPRRDKLDSVWLAKLTERGMLRPSFVPAGADPRAAGLHPAAHRPDPGPDPALVPAGEAAGGRADQGLQRGQHAGPPSRSAT